MVSAEIDMLVQRLFILSRIEHEILRFSHGTPGFSRKHEGNDKQGLYTMWICNEILVLL
jgi:hypothetical protein